MFKKFTKTVAILGAIMITLGVTTPAQAASCGTGKTTATVNVRTGEESSNSIKGYKVKKSLRVRAVAYSSGTHTALGTKLRYGVIAVDPKVIPYRTKVYIKELDRVFVAEDCGGGIKGKIIDIYMPSEAQCNRWGSRNITIQILK